MRGIELPWAFAHLFGLAMLALADGKRMLPVEPDTVRSAISHLDSGDREAKDAGFSACCESEGVLPAGSANLSRCCTYSGYNCSHDDLPEIADLGEMVERDDNWHKCFTDSQNDEQCCESRGVAITVRVGRDYSICDYTFPGINWMYWYRMFEIRLQEQVQNKTEIAKAVIDCTIRGAYDNESQPQLLVR